MRKLTLEDFIQRARKIHGDDRYGYNAVVYKGAFEKVKIRCPDHGEFEQTPNNHLAGRGCWKCSYVERGLARRVTTAEFIQRAKEIHGEVYKYDRTECSEGTASLHPVTIACPAHGEFEQLPHVHLMGHGCPKCGIMRRSNRRRQTQEDFIVQARRTHGTRYGYGSAVYQTAFTPVQIQCPVHGFFEQEPTSHLSGHGCPQCYRTRAGDSQRHTPETFLKKAGREHGDRYTYDLSGYHNEHSQITVICKKHGPFEQSAKRHLSGDGCPACSCRDSKGEQELFEFVKKHCPDSVNRNRLVIAPLELDIYVPSRKLAIEYNGMYWHSCDPLEGRNGTTLRDYDKWLACQKAGIDLFVVWESQWQTRRGLIEHWLLHKLGQAPRLCGARQAAIEIPSLKEANAFYERYHLQGQAGSCAHAVGLHYRDHWVAMGSLSKSPERRIVLPEGHFYFSRLAFAGSIPGAASRVFSALAEISEAKAIHAHSDNAYADGAVKKLLGFKIIGTLPPRYRLWHRRYGLRHRSLWQKSTIPKRCAELGLELPPGLLDTATTFELHRFCGCRHVWDFGKTRWLWQRDDGEEKSVL